VKVPKDGEKTCNQSLSFLLLEIQGDGFPKTNFMACPSSFEWQKRTGQQ
jgi:hypothetical protein